MRKHFLWAPCLGVIMLILFSCKKEAVDVETTQRPANEKLIPLIKSWLEVQKKDLLDVALARIESLESNLSYAKMRFEKYKESSKFIVIPVLSGFTSGNNMGKNPVNYLVLVFESPDSITKGNIIQYISSNEQKAVPINTFYKIFTYKDLDCSGLFTVLSITDDFMYELKFESEKINSIKEVRKRTPPNDSSGRVNDGCIDWYEQTWFVWADGTAELISEVYVFTSCDGECWQPRIANGRSLRVNCNYNGGGGNPIDYELALTATRVWYSWQDPNTPSMYLWSKDQYWGKRQAGNANGGYFTKIKIVEGGKEGFPYYMGVIITFSKAWHYTSITNHEVQGYITSQIAPNLYFTKTDVRQFSELWP